MNLSEKLTSSVVAKNATVRESRTVEEKGRMIDNCSLPYVISFIALVIFIIEIYILIRMWK